MRQLTDEDVLRRIGFEEAWWIMLPCDDTCNQWDDYHKAIDWLCTNKIVYSVISDYESPLYWIFSNQEDAVQFLLTWS